jgi:hypothetical protein
MAMKPMKKTATKLKAKSSNDYMKPVGGTKQKGYMAPGSVLKSTTRSGPGYSVGSSAQRTRTVMDKIKANLPIAQGPNQKYLKTGINPTAMKATSGNPKPTAAQLATAKKKSVAAKKNKTMETQAQKKKNTKPVMGSTKGATLKSPKPTSSPSTGKYKRGNP